MSVGLPPCFMSTDLKQSEHDLHHVCEGRYFIPVTAVSLLLQKQRNQVTGF